MPFYSTQGVLSDFSVMSTYIDSTFTAIQFFCLQVVFYHPGSWPRHQLCKYRNVMKCVYNDIQCFFYMYVNIYRYLIHIMYMNTFFFLHVCRTGRNPLIELRAYGILTNDWQPRWADPRLQVRWTNIVWEVSRLGGCVYECSPLV